MSDQSVTNRINLPGSWYLVRDDDPTGQYMGEWFLSEPGGIWVARFWDGQQAGEGDCRAFAESLGVQIPDPSPKETTDV